MRKSDLAIVGLLATGAIGSHVAAQQKPNPRQQPGATVHIFAPEQHDLYDGHFVISANRIYMVGGLNAIDWASRPYGTNAFTRKPSGVIGTSPGKIGTAVAQQHLRSILAFCNSPLMNSTEAYIQFEDGLINENGVVSDQSTRKFLQDYMHAAGRNQRPGIDRKYWIHREAAERAVPH